MSKRNRTSVTVQLPTKSGEQVQRTIHFVKDGCTYFHNAQHLFLQLERGHRALFDFLCEQMDEHNQIYIDKALKTTFTKFVCSVTSDKIKYEQKSVDQFIQALLDTGLLLRSRSQGLYIVNPKYAYSGTEVSRQRLLRTIIQERFSSGLDIQKLIDSPVEDFLSHPRSLPTDK